MSKLKDYKDKIKGFPKKITKTLNDSKIKSATYPNGFNQAHEIFSNLEFNPTELVELDKAELIWILKKKLPAYRLDEINKSNQYQDESCPIHHIIAQAIVDSRDIVKAKREIK